MNVTQNSTMLDPLIAGWPEALSQAVFNKVEGMYLAPLKNEDKLCHLFIASLPPSAKISAHMHHKGQELYYIIQGKGLLVTAEVQGDKLNPLFKMPIEKGESFGIPEGVAHEFKNISSEELVFILACSPDHFTTDRHALPDIGEKPIDPFFTH